MVAVLLLDHMLRAVHVSPVILVEGCIGKDVHYRNICRSLCCCNSGINHSMREQSLL